MSGIQISKIRVTRVPAPGWLLIPSEPSGRSDDCDDAREIETDDLLGRTSVQEERPELRAWLKWGYRDIVGLELKNRFESLAFFAAGPIMLMLNGGMHRPDGPITGATEIVFAAESVTAEYERLKKLGCSFVREPREVTPGSWAAVFSDPDGHWLTAFGPR